MGLFSKLRDYNIEFPENVKYEDVSNIIVDYEV